MQPYRCLFRPTLSRYPKQKPAIGLPFLLRQPKNSIGKLSRWTCPRSTSARLQPQLEVSIPVAMTDALHPSLVTSPGQPLPPDLTPPLLLLLSGKVLLHLALNSHHILNLPCKLLAHQNRNIHPEYPRLKILISSVVKVFAPVSLVVS